MHPKSLLIVLSVLFATGCQAAPASDVAPSPGGSADPATHRVLPSRELPPTLYDDARSAALELVGAYVAATDAITAVGGADALRIAPVVSADWLAQEEEGFEYYHTNNLRSVGTTVMSRLMVQSAHLTAEGHVEVGVLVCVDGTDLFVIPAEYRDPPESVRQAHPDYEDFSGDEAQWLEIQDYLSQPGVIWGDIAAVEAWLTGPSVDALSIDSWEQWWGVYPC